MATALADRSITLEAECALLVDRAIPIERARIAPPPTFTVSESADEYRVLSREASAEPGQWRTSRAPYQRGIMDAFSEPGVEEVVGMLPSQVGKSEMLLNVAQHFMKHDPAPMLAILPTIDEAEQWSKTRLAPMIRDSPALRDLVRDPRSRDSGNTLRVKEFPGGHITLVGANSPSGLAAKPIRVVLGDEIDRWPPSAGTEGNPRKLAKQRTATFWNRKIGWFSTPTLKGLSPIEDEYNRGDQRRYYVPCPDCDHMQVLVWRNLKWDDNHPETAAYMCDGCGVLIGEEKKQAMLARGEWRAHAPLTTVASFHLNALYSPWTRWPELVVEWLEAQTDLLKMQVFVNTKWAETWEDRGGSLDPSMLEARKERYNAEVPVGVGLLTAGVDVQADRVEMLVRGWGHGEESWLIAHQVYFGDPGQVGVWNQLRADLFRDYPTESGKSLRIAATGVDTGHHTDAVYAFVKPLYAQRVYAVKGSSTPGAPLLGRRPSVNNKARVRLFLIGTDAAKDVIYSRLKVSEPGPMYMHIPDWTTEDYFAQVTAEKVERVQINGRWRRRYTLPRGARNEALDCEVYALAALHLAPIRREQLGALAKGMGEVPAAPPAPAPAPVATLEEAITPPPAHRPRPVRRSGYINSWRR